MVLSYLLEHNRYMNLIGILVVLGIAALFSRRRSSISLRIIAIGLALQAMIALVLLKTGTGLFVLQSFAKGVDGIYQCADVGTTFLFGSLANAQGPWGFVFAIKILPIIIFFGAFTALLFHFDIIQVVVGCINMLIRPILGTSGAETLCAIANSFLGQTEAPLVIRNYLSSMTKSEMLVVMTSGMATISGAILMVYARMGVPAIHLVTASMMAIPSSIVIAKIVMPETEKTVTSARVATSCDSGTKNSFDAIFRGTSDGLQLAVNVAAMLISFLALLTLINYGLSYAGHGLNALFAWAGSSVHLPEITLQYLFSVLLAPFGYLFGFTGAQAQAAGQLLGTKIAVNEMIAFGDLTNMHLSERAVTIMTYALCGFSNFSCIGIQLGGIGALVPEKREWIAQLGLYAVLGGALSNVLSALIVALLL